MPATLTTEHYVLEYKEGRTPERLWRESHCHARYEMISVLEGDVEICLESRRYRLSAGQTLIVPPLCYHTVSSRAVGGAYRRVTALFSADAIPEVLRPRFEARAFSTHVFLLPQAARLAELCTREDKPFHAPLAEGLMTEALYACLEAEERAERGAVDERLHAAIQYVDANLTGELTLGQIAEALACSPSTVSHLFSARLGVSPKQYVLQKKMALAEREIALGTPPTVVAERLGYGNYSSFYRLYKKHFHRAPTAR